MHPKVDINDVLIFIDPQSNFVDINVSSGLQDLIDTFSFEQSRKLDIYLNEIKQKISTYRNKSNECS